VRYRSGVRRNGQTRCLTSSIQGQSCFRSAQHEECRCGCALARLRACAEWESLAKLFCQRMQNARAFSERFGGLLCFAEYKMFASQKQWCYNSFPAFNLIAQFLKEYRRFCAMSWLVQLGCLPLPLFPTTLSRFSLDGQNSFPYTHHWPQSIEWWRMKVHGRFSVPVQAGRRCPGPEAAV
jgi:hypothetical protein